MEVLTKNAKETQEFGRELNKLVGPAFVEASARQGIVLALSGNLGSGKTTFVQGFAEGLGIRERILSPTFVLMRQYDTKIKNKQSLFSANAKNKKLKIKNTYKNLKIKRLYHIDLYRLEGNVEEELKGLGIEEIWGKRENIVAIEWAEKVEKMLPKSTIWVRFEHGEGDERRIIVTS